MGFDRDAAIAYARRYWDRPCDDGVFWLTDHAVEVEKMRKVLAAPEKDGWRARFVPDGRSGIFQKGDMLGYFNIDPHGDYGGRRQYSHSTMFVGKIKPNDAGRITCHTKSRFGGLSAVSLRRTPSEIASLYAGLLVQEISVHDLVIHPGVTNGLTPLGVLKRSDRGRLSPALVRA